MRELENFQNQSVDPEGEDISQFTETQDKIKKERIDNLYNEITNLIKNTKPDGVELEDYSESVMHDLFEDVKKIQISEGRLLEAPEQTLQDAIKLFKSRLYSLLDRARNYREKDSPDHELVKKAKLALLIDDDFYEASRYTKEDPHLWSIEMLKRNIVGFDNTKRFTSSDIESLMKSQYRESIINSALYYYLDKDYGTCETIPKSLMIGFAQSKDSDRYYTIKQSLERAKDETYDDETLEQLLASGYAQLCIENYTKFKDKPLEKIITSGLISVYFDFTAFLLTLNLSQTDFDYYIKLYPKYNWSYKIWETMGRYKKNKQEEITILSYSETMHKIQDIDSYYSPNISEEFRISTISRLLKEGNVSFLRRGMYTERGIYTELKKYSEKYYEEFKTDIKKNNQEHLVLDLLSEQDEVEYIEKLVTSHNEYRITKYLKKLPEHSLEYQIYLTLKKKNFTPNLKDDLSRFKNLPDSEALEIINQGKADVFLNHFSSFNLTPEFLKLEEVQGACFKEFERNLARCNPIEARLISDKILFSPSKIDAALMSAIAEKWIDKDRIDLAWEVIAQFPHIRKNLETNEFKKRAFTDLQKNINSGYFPNLLNILQYFSISKELLKDPDVIATLEASILDRFTILSSDNFFQSYYADLKKIEKIALYIHVPAYIFQAKKVVELFEKKSNTTNEVQTKEKNPLQNNELQLFFVRNIILSPTPQATYLKLLKLYGEVKNDSNIASSIYLTVLYIEKFNNGGTEDEKNIFNQKIKSDIVSLCKNEPANFSKDEKYYKSILETVYPRRNYDSYQFLKQYEDRSHDLDKYIFNKDGYELKLSGVLGYKVKDNEKTDPEIIKVFSEHISRIKSLAQNENLFTFLNDTIENSKTVTLEGKMLEYFKQKGYSIETMDVLLAYQLIGSYDNFVAATSDRVSLEDNEEVKNYILLDELVNQYGDNMKETIKQVQSRVVNSIDGQKFTDNVLEKEKDNYSKIGKNIYNDLLIIPQDKLTDTIIQKKILKSIKNAFQTTDTIKGRAEYFALLFSKADMGNFPEVWSRHVDELFILGEQGTIDMKKIESLQSSVYLKLQKEISKYEEIKEVDETRNEQKLVKNRVIKGYFSKNKENAHARMVGDICIAEDPNMLKNKNYFEFVIFDEERKKCVGTTMLLEMTEPNNKKYLLYCPNPSVGLVSEVSTKKLYQKLTKQISKFASNNNFDGVLVRKTHGHSTNRTGLFQQSLEQSCLKDENNQEIEINLETAHSLNSSHIYQKNLQVVWKKD